VGFDRPTTPGNIGSIIRSADALRCATVIVTGHAADVYDRVGACEYGLDFALPAVRVRRSASDGVGRLRSALLGIRS